MDILAFERNGQQITLGAIAGELSEKEVCKSLAEFSIFFVEFGKPTGEFEPLKQKIIMNPQFNRIYEKGKIYWEGSLNKDKSEPYYCPVGWVKYACYIANSAAEFDEKYKNWPVAYHGTSFKSSRNEGR